MGIKKFKPTSPGIRHRQILTYDELTGDKPYKPLLSPNPSSGGRQSKGRLTVYGRGGGNKHKYRKIDFKRDKFGVPAKVKTVEYDPNRSAFISLVSYADGEKRYILAVQKLSVGDTIQSGVGSPIKPGCALPMGNIPLGSWVHNIELKQGRGGKIVRAAGTAAQLIGKESGRVVLRLPSGEIRTVSGECYATIGVISNGDHSNIVYGKAGARRWIGRRPKVRGSVMNPVDHPHGGGEGKSKGYRTPVSRTGVPAKGYRTRKKNKPSSRFILKDRREKRR